jgi:hypothetical protein
MPNLLDALNPITGIIAAASGIIDKFIPSAEDKAKAQLALAQLQSDATLKLAELDAQNAQTQASVITAEAKSESWLTRNWRPITMMVFVTIVAFNYIVSPLFSLKALPIPPDMWDLLKLGIGGYVLGRSVEKIAPAVAGAFTGKSGGAS